MRDCYKALREAYPDADDNMLKRAVKRMKEEVEAYKAEKTDATLENIIGFAAEKIQEIRQEDLFKRRAALMNLMAVKRVTDFALSPEFKDNPAKAVKALMAAGETRISQGGNRSAELVADGYKHDWYSALATAVQKSGFGIQAARSGVLDDAFAVELAALQGDTRFNPGQTGRPEIANLAKAVNRLQQESLRLKQDHGSNVKELKGRVMRTMHMPAKLVGNEEAWISFMKDRLDRKRSFKKLDDEKFDAALKEMFTEIATGDAEAKIGGGGLTDLGFGDVAGRLAEHRELHFQHPKDYADYNKQFGTGSMVLSIAMELASDAKDIGVMSVWGPNPDAVYTRAKAEIVRKLDKDGLEKFGTEVKDLDVAFKTMRGVSDAPGRSTGAKVIREGRAWLSSSSLGGTFLLSVPSDIVNASLRINNSTGKNFFTTISGTITDWARSMTSLEESSKALRDLKHALSDYAGQHAADSGMKPGVFSKAQNVLWKLGGMTREAAVMTEIMARKTQTTLAEMAEGGFESLNRYQRQTMQRFGIDQNMWDVMRLGVEDIEGRKMLTLEGIRAVPDEVKAKAAAAAGVDLDGMGKGGSVGDLNFKRFKAEMEMSYLALLQDNIRIATTTPGDRQKALLLGGTTEDQTWGMIKRLMTQFLATPFMLHDEMVRHTINAGGKSSFIASLGTTSGAVSLATRITALMGAGYATAVVSALIDGKTPPDPKDKQAIVEAFVRGGGAGLWSEYLIGNYDKTIKQEFGAKAVGPILGRTVDGATVIEKALRGDKAGGDAVNLFLKSIPGQNLWWSKAAMDMLVFQRLQEAASPGTARREEKRARERGQEYLFNKPTDYTGR